MTCSTRWVARGGVGEMAMAMARARRKVDIEPPSRERYSGASSQVNEYVDDFLRKFHADYRQLIKERRDAEKEKDA